MDQNNNKKPKSLEFARFIPDNEAWIKFYTQQANQMSNNKIAEKPNVSITAKSFEQLPIKGGHSLKGPQTTIISPAEGVLEQAKDNRRRELASEKYNSIEQASNPERFLIGDQPVKKNIPDIIVQKEISGKPFKAGFIKTSRKHKLNTKIPNQKKAKKKARDIFA